MRQTTLRRVLCGSLAALLATVTGTLATAGPAAAGPYTLLTQPGSGHTAQLWSPTDAQSRLLSLINGATTALTLYALELGSTPIVNALVSAANRGVRVRVVAEYSSSYTSNYNAVKRAGGQVVTYGSSDALYIHAKAIVADYGTGTAKIFLGSQNFSSTSLTSNRELGLIITDTGVISSVNATLSADFAGGTPW